MLPTSTLILVAAGFSETLVHLSQFMRHDVRQGFIWFQNSRHHNSWVLCKYRSRTKLQERLLKYSTVGFRTAF